MIRKRGSWLKKGATGLMACAAVGVGVAASVTPDGLLLPKTMVRADLMTLLEDRSPGERAEGALTQSKPYRTVAPFERVLPTALTRRAAAPPVTPGAATPLALAPVPFIADASPVPVPVAVPAFGPVGAPVVGGAPVGFAPAPAVFGPGVGASPPGTPPGQSPGTETPPTAETPPGTQPPPAVVPPEIVSPVPEPGTWAMMLLGFGVIGLSLRRRRDAQAPDRRAGGDAEPA